MNPDGYSEYPFQDFATCTSCLNAFSITLEVDQRAGGDHPQLSVAAQDIDILLEIWVLRHVVAAVICPLRDTSRALPPWKLASFSSGFLPVPRQPPRRSNGNINNYINRPPRDFGHAAPVPKMTSATLVIRVQRY